MDIKKVIDPSNLPARSPLPVTILYAMALDYWNAPKWLWGVMGTLLFFVWIAYIVAKFTEEKENIFKK